MVAHLNQDHSKGPSSNGNGVRICLIHPHEILKLGLGKVLQEILPRAEIITFSSPREALDRQDTKYDLLVTELNLKQPECSLSSLETLRNGFPEVRILALSPLSERHLGLPAM